MSTVNKPCIRKCALNEENICMGCFRSFDDMRVWHKVTQDEKVQMLVTAAKRKQEHRDNIIALSQVYKFI